MSAGHILCVNCVHYHPDIWPVSGAFGGGSFVPTSELARCKRTDLVDGTGKSGEFCAVERITAPGNCGSDGKYFEDKP